MNTTVRDVNVAFREKKMGIQLPYPEDWLVKDLQILEKKDTARSVRVLLALELVRDGKVIQDMCYLEGEIDRGPLYGSSPVEAPKKNKDLLPVRNRFDFDDDRQVLEYLGQALTSLLIDNDYKTEDHDEADVYGTLGTRGFFAMLACRCDEGAQQKSRHLIELRKKYKHKHDYALVVPAFQEPLGIALSDQEAWVMAHVDTLSSHRVGVYGVDNSDPNRVYPFTVYPQVRGLLRYFVAASRQWQDARAQYVRQRET